MRTVRIKRKESGPHGTFGWLVTEGFSCFTGELPWLDNASRVSCIPVGTYDVLWAMSPRFKRYTYRLLNVPDRGGVLIHSANLMGDKAKGLRAQLEGCIALGEKVGYMDGQKALLLSRPAVSAFERMLGGQSFKLEIS